jgi:hypothetical protein
MNAYLKEMYESAEADVAVLSDQATELKIENERLRAALAACRKIALEGYWAAKSAPEEAKFAAIDLAAKTALGVE